jgi:hypothetical protein
MNIAARGKGEINYTQLKRAKAQLMLGNITDPIRAPGQHGICNTRESLLILYFFCDIFLRNGHQGEDSRHKSRQITQKLEIFRSSTFPKKQNKRL